MALFVAASTIALIAIELWHEYGQFQTQAFRETRNLALLIDAHVERSIDSANDILRAFANNAKPGLASGEVDTAKLAQAAALLMEGMPQIGGLFLGDATGHIIFSTNPILTGQFAFADPDYLRLLASSQWTDSIPSIYRLMHGRKSGLWFIPLRLPIYDDSGKLIGVAVATIDPSTFVSLFTALGLGESGTVTLAQRDGIVVARTPNQEEFVGRSIANGPLFQNYIHAAPEGSVEYRGLLYGRMLLMSYRTVEHTPFVIDVAFDADTVFAPWRRLVAFYGVLGAAFLIATGACALLVRKGESRREQMAMAQEVQDIVDGMATYVVLLDLDGKVIVANRALLAAAGLRHEDVAARALWDTAWFGHSGEMRNRIRIAVIRAATGETVRSDFTVQISAQTIMTVDMTVQAIRDPAGETNRIVASGADVTDRRRLEQQLGQAQKMEAVGLLASGIAHDFNNLLASIAGFGEVLERAVGANRVEQAYVGRILGACERGKQMVAQLLEHARPANADRGSTDLIGVLAEVGALVRSSLPSPITLRLELGKGPMPVTASEAQLTQIFVNLCVNARDAIANGEGLVQMKLARVRPLDADHPSHAPRPQADPEIARHRAGSVNPDRTYAKVTVDDTGVGIDPATLKHVFEPFYTTKPTGKGTGLGLAVVHGTVLAVGGSYEVESRPGHGTRFSIYLPMVETEMPEEPAGAVIGGRV
ncbi:MAG TPA: cache domain-containing protein [Stellaceae bacterium]|nr:cache domain-containing protein [Stellaceae bacterium]